MRVLWLREQFMESTIEDQIASECDPMFMGSTCETAMSYLSHHHCFPAIYLLPGMTCCRVMCETEKNKNHPRRRQYRDMPHIMKHMQMRDLADTGYPANFEQATKTTNLNMKKGLSVGTTTKGERFFAKSPPNSLIHKDLDFYSTAAYLEMMREQALSVGMYDENRNVLRTPEAINKEMDRVMFEASVPLYKQYSPVAMELAYQEVLKTVDVNMLGYHNTMVEEELAYTNISRADDVNELNMFTCEDSQNPYKQGDKQGTMEVEHHDEEEEEEEEGGGGEEGEKDSFDHDGFAVLNYALSTDGEDEQETEVIVIPESQPIKRCKHLSPVKPQNSYGRMTKKKARPASDNNSEGSQAVEDNSHVTNPNYDPGDGEGERGTSCSRKRGLVEDW